MTLRRLPPYCIDMDLRVLRTAELFVLLSLRLWNTGQQDPDGTEQLWWSGFRRSGVDLAGTLAFDQLCRMIAIATDRATQVRALGRLCMSHDEGVFLESLGHLQRNSLDLARTSLEKICPPPAVGFALRPAEVLAGSLRACGITLPRRLQSAGSGARREYSLVPPHSLHNLH